MYERVTIFHSVLQRRLVPQIPHINFSINILEVRPVAGLPDQNSDERSSRDKRRNMAAPINPVAPVSKIFTTLNPLLHFSQQLSRVRVLSSN